MIEHSLQITLQINQSEKISFQVSRGAGDNVSSSNILYESHCKSISLSRVLVKYSDELETMFHHRTLPTYHVANQ